MKDERTQTKAKPEEPARRRRTQAERTAESDRRMLRAALKLIAKQGYKKTSLQAIGEEAGYSRGLVSHRFGSKEGLLWALVERLVASWGSAIRDPEVGDKQGIDAVCSCIDAQQQGVTHSAEGIRAFYALMFEALGPLQELRPKFAEMHENFRSGAEHWIRTGIEKGEIRADVDIKAQATILVGALRGVTYQWLIDPESIDLDATYAELKATLSQRLRNK